MTYSLLDAKDPLQNTLMSVHYYQNFGSGLILTGSGSIPFRTNRIRTQIPLTFSICFIFSHNFYITSFFFARSVLSDLFCPSVVCMSILTYVCSSEMTAPRGNLLEKRFYESSFFSRLNQKYHFLLVLLAQDLFKTSFLKYSSEHNQLQRVFRFKHQKSDLIWLTDPAINRHHYLLNYSMC